MNKSLTTLIPIIHAIHKRPQPSLKTIIMTRVLALTAQSKIGSAPQQRFAKAGIETPPQRGAALDRNGLSVSAETACRFEPKSPVGNSEICRPMPASRRCVRRSSTFLPARRARWACSSAPSAWLEQGPRSASPTSPTTCSGWFGWLPRPHQPDPKIRYHSRPRPSTPIALTKPVTAQPMPSSSVKTRGYWRSPIDYGCYVELANTTKMPQGLFQSDDPNEYVDVPKDDYRSIRRAILRLDPLSVEEDRI